MVEQRIKILHIIKSLGRGGAEMLLPETLKLHNKDKFEFHYIYFLPWKNQMVNTIVENGGEVTCFNASNNIQIILKANQVLKYIKTNNIELVHCHLPWAGILGRIIYKLSSVPVLYTEHNKQERYHRITFMLNKLTFNWQSKVLAVSHDVEESIIKNIKPIVAVRTVLNGVNTGYFKRADSKTERSVFNTFTKQSINIPKGAMVIGTIAVFRFQKRLKKWLQVFAETAKNNPDLYGIMVGAGPMEAELIEERKQLGLEERVLMSGLQTNTKEWYAVMDVFMMTSEFEGLPIALLEAMSMACAIVSTDAGGVKEVLEHEKSGLIVPVDNWQNLTQCLNRVLDEPLRKKIASGARERVVNAFSMERMVEELEYIYMDQISTKHHLNN